MDANKKTLEVSVREIYLMPKVVGIVDIEQVRQGLQ